MRERRLRALLAAVAASAVLTACGEDPQPAGEQPVPPPEEQPAQTPGEQRQEPGATADTGQQIFVEQCSQCHALADANATGAFGPNLDEVQPDAQAVEQKTRRGGGGMPPFEEQLSDEEIRAVSEYVEEAAGP